MKNLKIKKIVIPIYNVKLDIILYKESSDKFIKYLKENYIIGDDENNLIYWNNVNKNINSFDAFVVPLEEENLILLVIDNNLNLDTLVHEIIHIKNYVFDFIYHKQTVNFDEPEAYLTQYLFKEIKEIIQKWEN